MSFKTISVCYTVEDCFRIPSNIDLQNKEQVKEYWIKYNRLRIRLTNGKLIEVDSAGWIHSFDYKYPNNSDELVIEDIKDNELFEEEDFEDADVEVEKEVETEKPIKVKVLGYYNEVTNTIIDYDDDDDEDDILCCKKDME